VTTRPVVSVIIPAYNHGRFIEEALESALTQTYRDLEVIVVDDGSTDDTRERVARFGNRLGYVYQANAGSAAARNLGIRRSRGAYVAFLDADDIWLPGKVERCVEALEQDPRAGVAYHWWSFIDEAGRPLPRMFSPAYEGDVLAPLLLGWFVGPPMAVVRRSCLEQVGLFDESLRQAEDYDLFLRLALAGYRYVSVPEMLVRCRWHSANVRTNSAEMLEWCQIVLDRAFQAPRLPAPLRDAAFRAGAFGRQVTTYVAQSIAQGRWDEGGALLARGLRAYPSVIVKPTFYLGLTEIVLGFAGLMAPEEHATRRNPAVGRDAATGQIRKVLDALFRMPDLPAAIARRRRPAWAAFYVARAMLCVLDRRWPHALIALWSALVSEPLSTALALGRGARGHWQGVRETFDLGASGAAGGAR
jgi:GT2 family glycosyltransferase